MLLEKVAIPLSGDLVLLLVQNFLVLLGFAFLNL